MIPETLPEASLGNASFSKAPLQNEAPASTHNDADYQAETASSLMSNESVSAPIEAISYDFIVPENMNLNADQLQTFEAEARDMGLTNEQANKILAISAKNQEISMANHWETVKQWEDSIRKDKDMGGKHFEATVAYARAGMEKFDEGGKIQQMLHETGYGSHPDIVRFFAKLGRAHAEDTLARGDRVQDEKPRHERLYGKYNNL